MLEESGVVHGPEAEWDIQVLGNIQIKEFGFYSRAEIMVRTR